MARSSLAYIPGFFCEIFLSADIYRLCKFSIFSNSGHLEWRVGLSDTILKGNHPGTIPARFSLIWFSGFRGEDLNVNFFKWPKLLYFKPE
jgi:hypothetical protein